MTTRETPRSRALDRDSLWLLTVAPLVWAAHLLLSYATVAIWCAKIAAPGEPLSAARMAIAAYTAAALAVIGVVGWQGFRRHRHGTETTTHDLDTPEDRHRFLGFAVLLLAGLSALATIYAALAAAFFPVCH
jgi:hypothetical protein